MVASATSERICVMPDWKAILALAALCAPVAWCTAEDSRYVKDANVRMAEACLAAGKTWDCEEPTR